MNDVRDRQRIKTLPPDLKEVANKMLQDKFKLSTQGEVLGKEKPKPKQYNQLGGKTVNLFQEDVKMFDYASVKNATYPASATKVTLTMDDMRKAHDMLRGQEKTDYGLSPDEWIYLAERDERFKQENFLASTRTWDIKFKGFYTGRTITHMVGGDILMGSRDPVGVITRLQKQVQQEMVEPVVIIDPQYGY